MNRSVSRFVSLLLLSYHQFVSPLLPRSCRFVPSCSVYAAAAVERYGLARGAALALKRLGSCHPWNLGGFDPLP